MKVSLFDALSRVTQPSYAQVSGWHDMKQMKFTFDLILICLRTKRNAWARCSPVWCPGTCWKPIKSARSLRICWGPWGVWMIILSIQWAVTAMNRVILCPTTCPWCGSALCSTHDALFTSSFDRCFYFYCSFYFTRISLLKIKGGARSEEWTGNRGLEMSVFKLRLLQFWRNGIRGRYLSRAPSFRIRTFIFAFVTLLFFWQTLLRLKLFLEVGR